MLATATKTATDYRLGFTTLDREADVAALPLEGALPPWLGGSLLRNGPARFEVGAEGYRHWFDGAAMIHRFTIGAGRVSYANRFLRTPGFLEAERTGRIACSEFGTDPQRTFVEKVGDRLSGRGGSSENANVNIVPFRDGYLALTETPSPVAFDGRTLETRGVLAYEDNLTGQITTAHTHYDAQRRSTFNVVVEVGRTSRYHVVRIADGTFRRETIASIATDKPAYLHAFATTERYVILIEYPLVVRPLDLLLRRKPFIENYRWEAGRGTRFHLIEKDGGALAGTYESDATFAFHPINAFDERDAVVVDIAAYDDATIVSDFKLERLRADGARPLARPSFRRFRLVPGKTAAAVETLGTAAPELPTVSRTHAARPYAFAYGVDASGPDEWTAFGSLVKIDARDGSVTRWSAAGAYPGEPVFVPRPGATDEDDGAVLSVVLDARAGTSYLLVLDGRTFAEQARAVAPHHIPFGFHGMFRAAQA
jgi:carotenoid cleavage dioxygenase-like enzyme